MRALALFSGGLDSMVACRMMAEQGIEVIALHFKLGVGKTKDNSQYLQRAAQQAKAELKIIDISEQFTSEILFNPVHGYGKAFNPCIDCHGNMFHLAGKMLDELQADFIISGEVMGERPMSQNKQALTKVKKLSGVEDLILRPLSAKLLEESKPEREGWVDRAKLLDIYGRSRKIQMKMAEDFGFTEYESPGGGCLLTEQYFATKMREFLQYEKFDTSDIDVLKFFRHLRLPDGAKMVMARNEQEYIKMEELTNNKYIKFRHPLDTKGPLSLISKNSTDADKQLAAKIVITYSKTDLTQNYEVEIDGKNFVDTPFSQKQEVHQYFIKEI